MTLIKYSTIHIVCRGTAFFLYDSVVEGTFIIKTLPTLSRITALFMCGYAHAA